MQPYRRRQTNGQAVSCARDRIDRTASAAAGVHRQAIADMVDRLFAWIPRRVPDTARLRSSRIIAHRGAFDASLTQENTLPAFEAAEKGGAWGIEFDVRSTRDGTAVVAHDPDLRRVFGIPDRLADLTLEELSTRCPSVPSLEAVITRFGKRLHLMVEMKGDGTGDRRAWNRHLEALLSPLRPVADFHILSLDLDVLDAIDWLPAEALVAVAELGVARVSAQALRRGYGGFAGHYLLISDARVRRHARRHQAVGTGFVATPRCLYRELNRGVEWIFSNHAVALAEHVGRVAGRGRTFTARNQGPRAGTAAGREASASAAGNV